MTCIVAYKSQKKIFIGGDKQGSAGHYISIRKKAKVFIKKYKRELDTNGDGDLFTKQLEMGFGFTSSFRMGDIIEHIFNVPNLPKEMCEMKYMVSVFIPALIKCYEANKWLKKVEEVVSGGTFIVAFNQRIFMIEDDFQVSEENSDYIATGCGSDLAKGAIFAMKAIESNKENLEITPELKLTIALEASMKHSAWVGGGIDTIEI